MNPDSYPQAAQNNYSANTEANSLMKLANLISEATERVNGVTGQLSQVAHGIHGPRPEPVSTGNDIKQSTPDSISSRINQLLNSIERLQRSADAILR